MKPFALVLLAFALALTSAAAAPLQMKPRPLAIVPDSATVHATRTVGRLTPGGRRHVAALAGALAAGTLDPIRLEVGVKGTCGDDLGVGCSGADVEELTILVLMSAVQATNSDLEDQLREAQAATRQKAEARLIEEKLEQQQVAAAAEINAEAAQINVKLASLNEQSETQSLELQMTMDRRSKLIDTLSNVLKKLSGTNASIIQNMK
jgi:hypothetical protein